MLNTMMDSFFDTQEVGLCIQDNSNIVISQNQVSKDLCEDKVGKLCQGCEPKKSSIQTGITTQKNISMSQIPCDIATIQNPDSKLTIIKPITQWSAQLHQQIEDANMTSQEKNIIKLVLEKKTNKEIQDTIGISKSTLKTHINHIYLKLPYLKNIRDELKV
jgi:DNA-binding NarL/FixJ family response regulator